MSDKINLEYLTPELIDKYDYVGFLKKAYGNRFLFKYPKRYNWFKNHTEYKVLVAVSHSNKIIGQSCGYKETAIVFGEPTVFWWAVDTIVLSEYRGNRIGYKLQEKLHNELPNFSSAFYSVSNAKNKIKLGANQLFDIKRYYYPKDNFLSLLLSVFFSKFFAVDYNFNHFSHNIYTLFNKTKVSKDVMIHENKFHKNAIESIEFINSMLNNYDFYIKRSLEMINWKYYNNPSVKVNDITLKYNGKIIGVVFFSNVYLRPAINNSHKHICKILDVYIDPNYYSINIKIPSLIFSFFKKRNIVINGILSANKLSYFPELLLSKYPLMTTLNLERKIINPYISLADQDAEQME